MVAPVERAIDRSVTGIILGTTTVQKALANLAQSIIAEFVNSAVEVSRQIGSLWAQVRWAAAIRTSRAVSQEPARRSRAAASPKAWGSAACSAQAASSAASSRGSALCSASSMAASCRARKAAGQCRASAPEVCSLNFTVTRWCSRRISPRACRACSLLQAALMGAAARAVVRVVVKCLLDRQPGRQALLSEQRRLAGRRPQTRNKSA